MTQSVDSLFESAIERYKAGEEPKALIPVFKDLCDRTPKSSASWTCLAWLYLLENQPNNALKAAQKAVKLNPQDPQARVNLAAAMLETEQKGVRQHIEIVQQIMVLDAEIRQEIIDNIQDGLTRKPDWEGLIRIQKWLSGN
ncbi:tetratricopeptide repeat protein [Phormidium sp. LEGE 05292]|uniref:tetratricopeptide repeat protein n=1 Tax=[Phormidium] sp. LEGE 05292 TaxID=767427 RepID=UPI0018829032|nr:tetratricopeptide repeat protein [Phormidium sp. LEGE 05292]MBE9224455.1 tetratricopeptide repeat protein [Phormidium sp. LEGE 05292]